jgi:hypothetical protein
MNDHPGTDRVFETEIAERVCTSGADQKKILLYLFDEVENLGNVDERPDSQILSEPALVHCHRSIRRAEDNGLPFHSRFGVFEGRISKIETLDYFSIPFTAPQRDVSEEAPRDLDSIFDTFNRDNFPRAIVQRHCDRGT